jgi:hypothetical protein
MSEKSKIPPFIVNLSHTEATALPVRGTLATADDLNRMVAALQDMPPPERENERRLHIACAVAAAFDGAPRGAEKILLLGPDALRFLDAKERYLVENELKKRFGIQTQTLSA